MAESQAGSLKAAIDEILSFAKSRSQPASGRKAEDYCRAIARRDYDAAVKRHFDRGQLNRMLKEVRKFLPTLNSQIYRITDLRRLSGIADQFGVVLQARAFPGSDGAGFRGFYVNEAEVLKRPLICVNTAAHPATVAAAFWHEIGHHLTDQFWGSSVGTAMSRMNYRDLLSDPKEIAADMVRVLGGYPRPTAIRLFGGEDMEVLRRDPDALVAKAISHVRAVMGFDFQNRFTQRDNFYYLGGMIHTAKLRTTLLSEYGI